MATYSFLDVSVSLTGPTGVIDLAQGCANSDEAITMKMTDKVSSMTIGADGSVMHSLRTDRSGTITITLLKTSPVNKKLALAYNAQSMSSTIWGNNVIVIRNTASGDSITAHSCAFQKIPDYKNAKEGGTVTWTFDCGKIDLQPGEF